MINLIKEIVSASRKNRKNVSYRVIKISIGTYVHNTGGYGRSGFYEWYIDKEKIGALKMLVALKLIGQISCTNPGEFRTQEPVASFKVTPRQVQFLVSALKK